LLTNSFASILYICRNFKCNEADICRSVLCDLIIFLFQENNDMCKYDACAVAAPASEVTQLEAYLSGASITATRHCSGMYYTIDAAGSGSTPTICSTVSVKYKGQRTDGFVFGPGNHASGFQLGGLIEAWKKGIPLIKTWWKDQVIMSSFTCLWATRMSRNGAGVVVIPANSILIFEVELVGVFMICVE
jgi:FKBP-type peptidyl-prolyl cis-trans isomerase FkpA